MLLAVKGNTFPNNQAAIVDRFCGRQDFEIAGGQIAQRVEIVHLPTGIKEGVLGIVRRAGRADDHARGVEVLLPGGAGRAGRSTERPHVGDRVTELGLSVTEGNDGKKKRGDSRFPPAY